ncbi:nucleotidyltransferase domain-containing protein [Bradyrhizobium sp. LjRoot220]|uniref:nucleotidyltransferase family protein n=1 Tax=Bradyrhizobium sp. LjRoot220 TaxID=3342284 RepID=UPI003ECF8A44
MDLTNEQAAAIIGWGKRTPGIRAIILFGSRAKGQSRPESDVDLAIEISGQDPLAVFCFEGEQWQCDLRAATGLLVNIDFLGPDRPKVRAYVDECSLELFRRRSL